MGDCGFYLDSGDGEFLDEQQLAEPGTDACLVQYELLVDLGQMSTACCMQCRLARVPPSLLSYHAAPGSSCLDGPTLFERNGLTC